MIQLAFTTENSMEAGCQIRMRLVDGPFKRLNGLWTFTPQGHIGSERAFKLDFEFASGLLSMALGGYFKEVSESMVDAFCRQAAKKYGPREPLGNPR
ncbi:MAG: type II toxin-antitoxin system RatA family toxin [Methylococcus sp.]